MNYSTIGRDCSIKIGFLNDFIFTPSANVDGVMRFFSLKIKQLYYHYTHISG